MSANTKQIVKDWGPRVTLALWLLTHALALENRLSKLEQRVEDTNTMMRVFIEQHSNVATNPH